MTVSMPDTEIVLKKVESPYMKEYRLSGSPFRVAEYVTLWLKGPTETETRAVSSSQTEGMSEMLWAGRLRLQRRLKRQVVKNFMCVGVG